MVRTTRPATAPRRRSGQGGTAPAKPASTPRNGAEPIVAGEASMVERVYENMRRAILAGDYEPGQRLRLQEIAVDNQASFIPVREALRLLEMARLVEIIPNKGARVADISEADMIDVYDLRIVLEAMAVERACSRITRSELERAAASNARMVAALEAGDVEQASIAHFEFHLTLYRAARSPWLIHIIELLMASTERYRRLLTPARPNAHHLAAVHDQHREILEAVRQGDEAAARDRLREHLKESVDRFRKKLGERL